MARLVEQSLRPTSNCFVSVVISNKAGVLGLDIARELGVDSIVIESVGLSREQFEEQVTKVRFAIHFLKFTSQIFRN